MEIATTQAPPKQLKGMMVQMVYSRCLSVAAEMGIADIVGDSGITTKELATQTNANENALYRLIRVLASQGVFHIESDGKIVNSDASHFLRENIKGSQRNFARMMGSHWMWKVFNNLEHSINTGNTAFDQAFPESENLFQYFKEKNPKEGKIFSQAMSNFSYTFDQPLVDAYNFSSFNSILDVGGAEGKLLKTIKDSYPDFDAILFDLPHAIEQAKEAPRADELSFVAGNFFEKVEPKADCLIIKYVLHNWNDEACLKILQNCRKSINENGKLLIMTMIIEDGEEQVFEKSLDIVMQLLLGAKERTQKEYEELLAKSSFKLNRIISSNCPLKIIEVDPV